VYSEGTKDFDDLVLFARLLRRSISPFEIDDLMNLTFSIVNSELSKPDFIQFRTVDSETFNMSAAVLVLIVFTLTIYKYLIRTNIRFTKQFP
jgi:hypothetical protein